MAQWDVYPNPNPRARGDLPFLVDIQSDLLSSLHTRLMVPCAPASLAPPGLPRRMSPELEVAGQRVLLVPQEAGAVDVSALPRAVASLRSEAHRIVDALDAVVSGV
jgi:toxin CcdB